MSTDYSQLVNKSGTIYNTSTNQGYSDPGALATDLGVKADQINWGSIKADPNFNPTQTFYLGNQAVNYSPVTNKAIAVDGLNTPQTPLTIPQPDNSTSGADSLVTGLKTSVDNYNSLLTPTDPAAEAAQKSYDSVNTRINDLIGQDASKGTDQATAEQQAGLPDLSKQLSDINGQITTGTAEYQQLKAAYDQAQVANRGKPISMSSIIGNEAQIQYAQNSALNTKAADLGVLQARGQALQGNIQAAQSTVNRAIDLKYSSIENELSARQGQLSAISQTLNKAETKQANALQLAITQQQQEVATKKATEQQVQTIALQAAQNGASSGLIAKIQGATDLNTATQLATPYLAKVQSQVVDVNGHSLLIDSNTGKTLQDLGVSNSIIQANIAHNGSGTGNGTGSGIVDSSTDAGVKAIIAANPGEWGHAADAIDAKYGAGTATKYDSVLKSVYQNGQNVNSAFGGTSASSLITPYLNTASNGIQYIDASTLQGTPTQKTAIINEATAAGLKVITNKNTAADLVNIQDAKSKLDTIGTIFSGIAQPTALSRDLYGIGLTKFASLAQTNTQQAAAGALQSVGLDILKAISGVQGFRGNQSAIQQVTEHLPTIYDTQAVVAQKIDYINQLISDRENAALGTTNSNNSSNDYNAYLKAIGQ